MSDEMTPRDRAHVAVLHAVRLLRWWAEDETDEPEILEIIQQSKEVADELEATIAVVRG